MVLAQSLALLAAIAFAAASLFVRKGTKGSNFYTAFFLNVLVGAVGLWILLGLSLLSGGSSSHYSAQTVLTFVVAGIIGTSGGRLLRFASIEKLGASVGSSIQNIFPLVSSLLAVLVLGERVTTFTLLGTAMIVLGTILLSTTGTTMGFKPRQVIYPLLSAVMLGSAFVIRKIGLVEADPVFGTTVNVSAGLLSYTVFLVFSGSFRFIMLNRQSTLHFVWAGVTENLGVLLLFYAISLGDVSVVIPLGSSSPLFILPLAYFFLRGLERVNLRIATGAATIVLGIYFIMQRAL